LLSAYNTALRLTLHGPASPPVILRLPLNTLNLTPANPAPVKTPAIEISGLSHVYRAQNESVLALDQIDLTVNAGEFVAVVGPSGCGKTTLLRSVAGLLRLTAGRLNVFGRDSDRARRDRTVGLVTQDPGLLPWLTVRSNVGLALDISRSNLGKDEVVQGLLERVGIVQFADFYPNQLSGGMRQRVALARSLVHHPRLLLMDEPFGALDELSREKIRLGFLTLLEQEPAAVMFVTHSIREAVIMADRVVVMTGRPGRIRSVISVELERPRLMTLEAAPKFQQLVSEIRALMSEESIESSN